MLLKFMITQLDLDFLILALDYYDCKTFQEDLARNIMKQSQRERFALMNNLYCASIFGEHYTNFLEIIENQQNKIVKTAVRNVKRTERKKTMF